MHKAVSWINEKAADYCIGCPNTCCDGTRHIISINQKEGGALELFAEYGVPVYRKRNLETASVGEWLLHGHAGFIKIKDKKGKSIPKPALIEHPKITITDEGARFGRSQFSLYVNSHCPLYDSNRGCLVHNDIRRPEVCKNYPIFMEGRTARLAKSCNMTANREIITEFLLKFPKLEVILK